MVSGKVVKVWIRYCLLSRNSLLKKKAAAQTLILIIIIIIIIIIIFISWYCAN